MISDKKKRRKKIWKTLQEIYNNVDHDEKKDAIDLDVVDDSIYREISECKSASNIICVLKHHSECNYNQLD